MAQGKKEENQDLDKKDAYAALLAGCKGCSEAEARQNIENAIATGSPGLRALLERAMDHASEEFRDLPPEKRRKALRKLGKQIFRDYMKRQSTGLRPERLAGPGGSMLRIACLLYPKRKVVRVFLPLISDYEREFTSARRESYLKATLTTVEWWCRFGKACGLDVVLQLAGGIAKFVS